VPSHLSSSKLRKLAGRIALRALGWEASGEVPPSKCVMIAAPHTSNWDGLYMLAIAWSMGLRLHWMGKHTLFEPPFGPILKALGGIPIDRRAKHGVVEQMVRRFEESDALVLAIPPEGTRKRGEHWKSGFMNIAKAAHVPIVLGFLDYAKKEGGIGPAIMPTGDLDADVATIREFYEHITAKYPEHFTNISFAKEPKSG
jgi:1-acyl-sn-glycerol-3-phosphate acyltransferase